ncbi:MAG: hypothetical protein AABZ02_14030 [Bacteroidota bacterium]
MINSQRQFFASAPTAALGGYGSLTLEEVFNDHIKPLNVPASSSSMIGHIENKFTLLIGVEGEIDAQKGTIQMLEPAVE